jgi:hypothetical protein
MYRLTNAMVPFRFVEQPISNVGFVLRWPGGAFIGPDSSGTPRMFLILEALFNGPTVMDKSRAASSLPFGRYAVSEPGRVRIFALPANTSGLVPPNINLTLERTVPTSDPSKGGALAFRPD